MGSDNSGAGAAIAFLVGILILAFATTGPDGEREPLFSIDDTNEQEETRSSSLRSFSDTGETGDRTQHTLSNKEIERKLNSVYSELEQLEEKARTLRLWGERSSREGQISLRRGNVFTEDVDREYLIITASSNNEHPINITNWRVESVVTQRARWIEPGIRTYRRGRINERNPIVLEPGERAYLISGESPIDISFHENKCTGYLREHNDFYPRLARSCPRPMDELKEYGRVDLDNDACYAFVERIGRCEIPDSAIVEDANLSRACEQFLIENLSYSSCVDRYRLTPFFDEGEWYIYLKREEDLWRAEREIIRLRDDKQRTVDVIEY